MAASELASVADQVRAQEANRDLFLYVAGGLALAAGVEAFFTDWRNDRAAIVPLATPGGAGMAVAGRF